MTGGCVLRRLAAEFLGTALLLTAIVGSGIVTATDGAASTQLFQHAVAVGAALGALILIFGPVSGAHFNPAVTLADWWFKGLPTQLAGGYVAAQVTGAVTGTVAANLMFGHAPLALSSTVRGGAGPAAGEAVATLGLLLVIFALVRTGRTRTVPAAVGAWIGGAILFTSSAAFANPAVTLARALTDSWTGIAVGSLPDFVAGQALGTLAAIALIGWFYAPTPREAANVVVAQTVDPPTDPARTP